MEYSQKGGLIGNLRSSPSSSFVTGDTDVTPQSGTFHTANRYVIFYK